MDNMKIAKALEAHNNAVHARQALDRQITVHAQANQTLWTAVRELSAEEYERFLEDI